MPKSVEMNTKNNMKRLIDRAETLKWILIPIFCISAVVLLVSISVLMNLSVKGFDNQDLIPLISILRVSQIMHGTILIILSIIYCAIARTKTKYETALLIHQKDLELIIDERTRSLNHRTRELESIYNALPDSFLQISKDGLIQKVYSSNSIKESSPAKLIGETIYSFLPKNMETPIAAAITRTLTTGKLSTVECDLIWNGESASIECRFIASLEDTVTCIIRDITKRREYEKSLKSSLTEREVLLGEVHHRVRNNLMIIVSLVNLYEDTIDGSENIQLQDLRNRIYSLSLIHEQLINSDLLSQLKFNNYIGDLTSALLSSFAGQDIKFRMSIPEIYFSPDKVVPLGLITTELLTTALRIWPLKPAEKIIDISVKESGGEYEMVISCINLRLLDKQHEEITGSLGAKLVEILVKQLNGTISFNNADNAIAVVKFPA